MRDRFSARRLFLTILLSQAMAIQALLLAWNGTQIIVGNAANDFATICYGFGAASTNRDGGSQPNPVQPKAHRDCLAACLAGHVATNPPDRVAFLSRAAIDLPIMISRQMMPLSSVRAPAFQARAPPMPI